MKQKANELETGAIAKRVEYIKSETGLPITMKVDWDSFGEMTEKQLQTLDGTTGEIANKIIEICGEAMAKQAITEKIASVEISNDTTITVPEDFVLKVENKVLSFSANFEIFFTNNTSEHKTFLETLKGIL